MSSNAFFGISSIADGFPVDSLRNRQEGPFVPFLSPLLDDPLFEGGVG